MAYYNLENERNGIMQIQRLLRDMDYRDSSLARIRINGEYNEETKEAVRSFQEKYDLPTTGVVDYTTWQLLHAIDKAQKESFQLARAVYLLPRSEEYTITPGTQDDVVFVIQYMLNVIGQEIDEIGFLELTGIYDIPTENAIKVLQRKSLIEPNGILDPLTYNRLADQYERINSYNQ